MQALDDAAEFREVALPWRGLPPGEADPAVRLRRRKRQDLDVAPPRFGFQADARKQRDAQSIRDHLNNGGKACRSKSIEVFNLLEIAKAQRLVAQAMPSSRRSRRSFSKSSGVATAFGGSRRVAGSASTKTSSKEPRSRYRDGRPAEPAAAHPSAPRRRDPPSNIGFAFRANADQFWMLGSRRG